MADTPVVSVIIPTRNCLHWLPQAIASIGPFPDAEIIVFDDGSTDGTRDWLVAAAHADRRLVLMQGTGIGPAKARNRAIAAARAPLLAFLDADDQWYPGKLEAQLALHQAWPETSFSFTDYRHVTETGEDRGTCFAFWPRFRGRYGQRSQPFALGGDAIAQLFAENVVGTSTVMARTDFVRAENGFADDLPSSEDWDLWLRLTRRGQVMCIPQVMADYLMHRPGNATGNLRARALAMRIIGGRHEAAVRKLSHAATRSFRSRILEANAEIARANGCRCRCIRLRLAAFVTAPSRRGAGELLGAMRAAVSGGQTGS